MTTIRLPNGPSTDVSWRDEIGSAQGCKSEGLKVLREAMKEAMATEPIRPSRALDKSSAPKKNE